MCRNVLENNFAARAVLDLSELPKPPFAGPLPNWLWKLQRPVVARFFVWFTVGLYDPPVRELMGYGWSPRDERVHRLLGTAVGKVFTLLPRRARMHPRARAGWDRVTGRVPVGSPPPETPARNLPPLDRRGNPMHYCPNV